MLQGKLNCFRVFIEIKQTEQEIKDCFHDNKFIV